MSATDERRLLPVAKALRSLRYDSVNQIVKRKQVEVADQAKVSNSQLSYWEAGRGNPNEEQLARILKVYRVSRSRFEEIVNSMRTPPLGVRE